MKITRRQREVLDHLSEKAAFTRETARAVYSGMDSNIADTLAARGVINKRYNAAYGPAYWIRSDNEAATTARIPTGFVVILSNKHVTTPSGRTENLFLARASWDGKGPAFRRLLRGWMQTLNLRSKDLSGGTWGFEVIPPDAAVFNGDHVILDEGTEAA